MSANQDATRFPLAWPTGWPRTAAHNRKRAAFSKRVTTGSWHDGSPRTSKESLRISDGLARLTGELRRVGAQSIVISSNLHVSSSGVPFARQAKQLQDPGVAVYFHLARAPRALACDKWLSAAENMAAIAAHIEAIRAQGRYGVCTLDQAHRGLSIQHHPDHGGSHEQMARINGARDEALRVLEAMRA